MKEASLVFGLMGVCFGLGAYLGLEVNVVKLLTPEVATTVRITSWSVYCMFLALWLK